jgi:hypothetical protein
VSQNQYRSLLAAKEKEFWDYREASQKMQAEYVEALAADYKKAFPKRKAYTRDKYNDCPNREALKAYWQGKADALISKHVADKQGLEDQLDALAAREDLLPWSCEGMNKVYSILHSTYQSSDLGSGKYARESAESRAEDARMYGLKAEVKFEGHCYDLYVNTDEVGWDLVQRKPGISLKAWIKRCWARGCNPRVYNPFLPVGLEEKLGLDYFGGEIKAK